MGRPKIKFSHSYFKMQDIDINEPVILLEIFKIRLEDLSEYFLRYDTAYIQEQDETIGNYPLPKRGEYMILLFAQGFKIFTTIRPVMRPIGKQGTWAEDKYSYYLGLLGKEFDVKVKGVNS